MKNPLLDLNFLKELDRQKYREVFAKIIALNKNEEPIEAIEGRVTAGTINIDGSSAIRKTCNLTIATKDVNINNFYWGLTNKFKLYLGVSNAVNSKYEDIIWIPQGIFVIFSFKTSYNTKKYNIQIQGKDKMCLLNGDVGGNLPTAVDFAYEEVKEANAIVSKEKRSIHYMIREMIHYYGNEPFHNIVIRDVDENGLELLEYTGQDDIYIFRSENGDFSNMVFDGDIIRYEVNTNRPIKINDKEVMTYYSMAKDAINTFATWVKSTNDPNDKDYYQVVRCAAGDTAGYKTTPLVWPGEEGLVGKVGETITSILDKIVKTFGNYEYFYDVDGKFVFQQKLTYVNSSWNNLIKVEGNEEYIESDKFVSQIKYNFADSYMTSSYNHTPDFKNIKNDFSIWGKKNSSGGSTEGVDIHLRYGIQHKPKKYTTFNGETYVVSADQITYQKKPNPNGLSEDWWEVADWAEYYKKYVGHYPEGTIGQYCTSGGDHLDLNTIFGISTDLDITSGYGRGHVSEGVYGMWDTNWETAGIYIFDVVPSGTLGYVGHRTGCGHSYDYFLSAYERGIKSYIYKPLLPEADLLNGLIVDWRELIYQMAVDYLKHNHDDDFEVVLSRNNPEYPYGTTGYEQYYTDMLQFWRGLYNLNPPEEKRDNYFVDITNLEEKSYFGWNRLVIEDPSALIFWFDLLDTDGSLSKYSISAIGDRTKSVNDDKVKSIVYKETPTLIYISPEDYKELKESGSLMTGYTYVILNSQFEQYFRISTQTKSAQQELDNLLYKHAYVNEQINLQGLPIYYLNPNTKITVHDDQSHIYGEYIINKLTIPLGHKGTMTINASKAPIRLY